MAAGFVRLYNVQQFPRTGPQQFGFWSSLHDLKRFTHHRNRIDTGVSNPPGEPEVDFNPSMGHALFLMNEEMVLDWLKPKSGNLVERLSKQPVLVFDDGPRVGSSVESTP